MNYLKYGTLIVFLFACKSENERKITGKWAASKFVECGEVVPIQTDLVSLEIKNDGQYIFNSTLNVREEGRYRIKGAYLYTLDLLKKDAPEKIVKIDRLEADTLALLMNNKGNEQTLTFVREAKQNLAKK